MSNYLAIATVTATLKHLLQEALATVPDLSAPIVVRTGRPENPESSFVGVNICLYQVVPNAAFRNADLPTWTSTGTLSQKPQVALDLHYLLTFSGREEDQEPQRLMGCSMVALHGMPILDRTMIQQAIIAAGSESYLVGSDLENQIEKVKFSLLTMNLEELSKLWTVFYQVTHTLSIAYQASVVLLEGEVLPQKALLVKQAKFQTHPKLPASIDKVHPSTLPYGSKSPIILTGQGIGEDLAKVTISGQPAKLENVTPDQVTIVLPSSIVAGANDIQIYQKQNSTKPGSDNLVSKPAQILIQPHVTGTVQFATVMDPKLKVETSVIAVDIKPQATPNQSIMLLLNPINVKSGVKAFGCSLTSAMWFTINSTLLRDLDHTRVSESLIQQFAAEGIMLSSYARIHKEDGNQHWTLQDKSNQQTYRLFFLQNTLVVFYGQFKGMANSALLFSVPLATGDDLLAGNIVPDKVLPGTYLVRVQVGSTQSPLQSNAKTGSYNAPKVVLS